MKRYEEYMPCTYDTPNDVDQRLNGTYCRYKGVPYFVRTNGMSVHLYDMCDTKKKAGIISVHDDDFDISMVELGYCNIDQPPYKDHVLYAFKFPNKQYKAALSNLYLFRVGTQTQVNIYDDMPEGVRDSIVGNFPSSTTALEMINSRTRDMVAISQDVCFVRDVTDIIFVYYRQSKVGWMTSDSMKINMADNKYRWVVERLLSKAGIYVQE